MTVATPSRAQPPATAVIQPKPTPLRAPAKSAPTATSRKPAPSTTLKRPAQSQSTPKPSPKASSSTTKTTTEPTPPINEEDYITLPNGKRVRKIRKWTKRKGVPPPPSKHITSFTEIPLDALSLIASFLLTSTHSYTTDGFLHPSYRPYPNPSRLSPEAIRTSERFGSVPQAVLDVINFAKCSRLTMAAARKIMTSFGGTVPCESTKEDEKEKVSDKKDKEGSKEKEGRINGKVDKGKSKEKDVEKGKGKDKAAETEKKEDCLPKRSLYIQMTHCGDKGENIRQLILDHKETVEEVVFYNCPLAHFKPIEKERSAYGYYSRTRLETPIVHSKPYNLDTETTPLSKLRKLQIGPKMCESCSIAVLHLLCANKYKHRSADGDGEEKRRYNVLGKTYHGWAETAIKPAASNLEQLEIHCPDHERKAFRHFEVYLDLTNVIALDVRNNIRNFTYWIPSLDHQWGGFGRHGTSSGAPVMTTAQVEKELDELVGQEVMKLKMKPTRANEDTRLAKYKNLAKSLIPVKPAAKEVVPEAIGSAAKKIVEEAAKKKEDVSKDAATSATEPAEAVVVKTEPEESPSDDEDHADMVPDSMDEDDEDDSSTTSISGCRGTPPVTSSGNPSDARRKSKHPVRTRAQRGEYLRNNSLQHYPRILNQTAEIFPNLHGLRIFRSGTLRMDIVEGGCDLDVVTMAFVTPLKPLKELKYLDLDLVVVGRKEASDFPLAMSVYNEMKKDMTEEERQVAEMKQRLWKERVEEAVKEGDQWREKVLEVLLSGKATVPETETDIDDAATLNGVTATPGASSSAASTAGSGPVPEHNGWPKGITSGHIYTLEIVERAKRRGVLCEWSKVMQDEGEGNMVEKIVVEKSSIIL